MCQLFEGKDRARERCIKCRRQPGARPRHKKVAPLIKRTMRQAADARAETGAKLDAWTLAPKREPGTDAENRTEKLQSEDTRPIHLHLVRKNTFDLRNAGSCRHRVFRHNFSENPCDKTEQDKPKNEVNGHSSKRAVKPRKKVLRQYEQIAKERNDKTREAPDDQPLNKEPKLQMLRLA